MRDALRQTGRPIVFSLCEWGENKPWEWASDVGHLWRTTGDISDGYTSMLAIAKQNWVLADFAGPGHWNDPDMLEVGNGLMTDVEYQSHFSLWSIMAAPLLIGTDLRKASPSTLAMLSNRDVIAIDQDPLGAQGKPIRTTNGLNVLVKPLQNGDKAVLLFNEGEVTSRITTTAAEIGLPSSAGYKVRDLWAHTDRETAGTIAATVPPHGSAMFRVSADRQWLRYAPAVDSAASAPTVYAGALPLTLPGKASSVTTTVTNSGRLPAIDVRSTLSAPAGWSVQRSSSPTTLVLPTNRSFSTKWTVTAPAGVKPGLYPLTVKAAYQPGGTSEYTLNVAVPDPAPTAPAYLSDLPWLRTTNGWGPVERDHSNGEANGGDGNTITINGVKYAKGLGAHAPSYIEFYVNGKCTSVTADVGVDDEQGVDGSANFEVWADGTKVTDSGKLTNLMPSKPLEANISGATLVRLITADGGDGNSNDHGDWANAHITCG
jgi:alpha-galactosidase